jgi:hypothetical protein
MAGVVATAGAATLLAVLATPPRAAHADEIAQMARSVEDKYKDAVVNYTIVLKISGGPGGEDQNEQTDGQGVVIDPSGLIATAASTVDPVSFFSTMVGADSPYAKMTSKVVSIRVLNRNGEDQAARIVLRDNDRNLAFLRLVTPPSSPMTAVDLSAAGKSLVSDPVFVLQRLGKAGNRESAVLATRVMAELEHPRLLYVLQGNPETQGDPVFSEDGKVLGLLDLKAVESTRNGRPAADALAIVVPAADVLEDALQAPQIKDLKDDSSAGQPAPAPAEKQPAKKLPG